MEQELKGVEMVQAARLLARFAHFRQVDKAGKPYIDHPRRVAALVKGGYEAEAVALTRTPWDTPWEYYYRVKRVPLAREVKLADIADNMDSDRLAALTVEYLSEVDR